MSNLKFAVSARGLHWLSIAILVAALAGCHNGSSAQSNNGNSSTNGNPVNNESVLNQKSGTG